MAVFIVCEFDPFHYGHEYLISEARRLFPGHTVVCVMSGNFVQRGNPALYDEYARARCAIEGRNIVLHTKGETKRNYLFTEDAAEAILTVLLKGENGEAYNAANEETYCSIYDMAKLVAEKCAGGGISVDVQLENIDQFGYAPTLMMNLDTSKLRALGWKANIDLFMMFADLIRSMETSCNE